MREKWPLKFLEMSSFACSLKLKDQVKSSLHLQTKGLRLRHPREMAIAIAVVKSHDRNDRLSTNIREHPDRNQGPHNRDSQGELHSEVGETSLQIR